MGKISYVTIRGSKLSFGYPQNELCENLNADMVDNYHASQIAKPFSIPVAGADGKIDPEYLPAGIGGGDIKVVIDYVDYHKYVKQNEFIYITPQAHTDQSGASIDYYKWVLPNGDITTTSNSNPTLVYEDTSELGTLTFRVTAVDTYGNQSVSKTINIEIVEELPPVINSISWNMIDFYENKSYIMTVNAESYENKPLSYQVTCDDPSITIENYQDQQNKFLVTFPELTEEKLYNLNVVVSDGDLQDEKEEQCVAKPMLDFVYRFENVYACSNIVVDNQGYLYIAVATSNNQIIFEKMDKALLTVERKAYNISAVLADSSTYKGRIALFVANDYLYAFINAYDETLAKYIFYLIEIDRSTLSINRTSKGYDIQSGADARIDSVCVVGNNVFVGCAIDSNDSCMVSKFSLDTLAEERKIDLGDYPEANKKRDSSILYDPTQDRIIVGHCFWTSRPYVGEIGFDWQYVFSQELLPYLNKRLSFVMNNGRPGYLSGFPDSSNLIINDRLYRVVFGLKGTGSPTTLAHVGIFDLSNYPDPTSLIASYTLTSSVGVAGTPFPVSCTSHTHLLALNSTELLYLFQACKGSRGGSTCYLVKFSTDFEMLGSAKIDSVNDDYSDGIVKRGIIVDGYLYLPIKTKLGSNSSLCIMKINPDNITNETQSFSLQSNPFFLDTGCIDITKTEGGYAPSLQDFTNSPITSELELIDTPISCQEVTPPELETYRDPFI